MQRTILRYFAERIATGEDPRRFGKAQRPKTVTLGRWRHDERVTSLESVP